MKILKFYTTYCSQCKQQDRLLKDFTDVEIVPVDCDENEELTDKYGVRGLPTLVILNDKEEVIKKFTGIVQLDTIKGVLKNYENY